MKLKSTNSSLNTLTALITHMHTFTRTHYHTHAMSYELCSHKMYMSGTELDPFSRYVKTCMQCSGSCYHCTYIVQPNINIMYIYCSSYQHSREDLLLVPLQNHVYLYLVLFLLVPCHRLHLVVVRIVHYSVAEHSVAVHSVAVHSVAVHSVNYCPSLDTFHDSVLWSKQMR